MGRCLKRVALLAECSPRIGSGHVVETLNLLPHLKGLEWRAFVGSPTPEPLFRRFGGRAERLAAFSAAELSRLARRLSQQGYRAAALNVLRGSPAQVVSLQSAGLRTLCMTASGRPPAAADARLAFDAALWKRVPGGPAYTCFDRRYVRLARKPRRHAGPLRDVMIIMGGTDTTGTTIDVVRALRGWRPDVRKHVIAGPNFVHQRALDALLETCDRSFFLHRDPADLPGLMRRCDAALTFGSNTSLELACVGTPMILFYEARHERRQAAYLAEAGCGFYVGSRTRATPARLARLLDRLDDPRVRARMARAGRRLVDGRGAERVAGLLRRLA